jgi:hypothetical protein
MVLENNANSHIIRLLHIGYFYINDDTTEKINLKYRSQIGGIIHGETPFEGTLLENIRSMTTQSLKI